MTIGATPDQIAKALGSVSVIPGGYKCRCPAHDDGNASLQITIAAKDGRPTVYCHAGCSAGKIYRCIEDQTGLHFAGRESPSTRTEKKVKLLIPATLPFPPNFGKTGLGVPDVVYEYRNEKNQLCCVVGRWDTNAGKQIFPATCVESNGQAKWSWMLHGYTNLPLYNTPELVARLYDPVLVVEGEKTANAAKQLFPEYVVVTYQGGAKNFRKSDWSLLKGRDIILWPDNDAPGREAFHELGQVLNIQNFAKSVKMAKIPITWPKGWDLADEAPEDLSVVTFVDGPKGELSTMFDSVNVGNYMEFYDNMYWLYYDGRIRATISKQERQHSTGGPFGLDRINIINTNHEAWRTLMLKEGPSIQMWADEQKQKGNYISGERFEPNGPDIIEDNGQKYINIFNGWRFEENRTGSCEAFKQYILHVICNGDEKSFLYVWNYLAHLLQFPSEMPGCALVFRGIQGAGKSFFGLVIGELLGGAYGYCYKVSTIDSISGKFNAHMAGKLMIVVEELELTKSRSMDNRLKSVITDPMISIERKGKDPQQMKNYVRVIGSSNHSHLWNVTDDERRFVGFDVSNDRANDRAYFGGILEELRDGGFGRLMYELLHYDVDHALIGRPLENSARNMQKVLTPEPARDLALRFLRDGFIEMKIMNERGDVPKHFQAISGPDWQNGQVFLSSKIINYVLSAMIQNGKYTENYTERDKRRIATTVIKYLGGTAEKGSYRAKDVYINNESVKDNSYPIPSLQEARIHFANVVGVPFGELFDEDDTVVQFPVKVKNDPPF